MFDDGRKGDFVKLGAIITLGTSGEKAVSTAHGVSEPASVVGHLACVEIMGRSVTERMVDRFVAIDAEIVSILADARVALPPFEQLSETTTVRVVDDVASGLSQELKNFAERGIEFAFVVRAEVYSECDLMDWIWFHRGTRSPITRSRDSAGGLDFWVVDCAKLQHADISALIENKKPFDGPTYFISEYVNRVKEPSDFRRLVTDVFQRKCEMHPPGKEIRPGVWVEADAKIHRRARIIAPAYIGRGAQVREDTVITRCSNLESSCYVDYGTVIEDSSVLANSYVGIWLDVSHAVVKGNRLANVGRNVVLEISDRSVMRENMAIT